MDRPHSAAYQRPAGRSVSAPQSFDCGLAGLAKRLRLSVPNLTEYERHTIEEFARGASVDGEIRYRQRTFKALMALAARSRNIADRDALPELVRAEILANVASHVCVEEAFDRETAVTGPADVEQRAFERNPNPITWARCTDALKRQMAATETALASVLACKTWE